jgi:hypothetical protein
MRLTKMEGTDTVVDQSKIQKSVDLAEKLMPQREGKVLI